MSKLTPQEFQNFWTYFNDESHQVEAVKQLYEVMPESLLESDSRWVMT